MTPVNNDQVTAGQRDLSRLTELVTPHLRQHTAPDGAPGQMTPGDRAEAEAILSRLADPADSPVQARERQKMLLGYADMEAHLREILGRGEPRFRNGKIVTDPETGEPLRNLTVDRNARAALRKLERQRSRITGIPPTEDDEPPT